MKKTILGLFAGALLLTTLAAQGRADAAPAIVYQGMTTCFRPFDAVSAGSDAMTQTGFTSSPNRQNASFVVGVNGDTSVGVESTIRDSGGHTLITFIATSTTVASAQSWLNTIVTKFLTYRCI